MVKDTSTERTLGTPSTYSNPHLEQEAVAAVLLDGRGDALGFRDDEIVSDLQWNH